MTTDSITRLIRAILETAQKIRESRAAEAIGKYPNRQARDILNIDILKGLMMHVMASRTIFHLMDEEFEYIVGIVAKLAQTDEHSRDMVMRINTLANFETTVMDEWTAAILAESVCFNVKSTTSIWFQLNETLYCAKHCIEFAQEARAVAQREHRSTLDSIITDCLSTILRFHTDMPPATREQFAQLFAQYVREAPEMRAFQLIKKARELVVLTGGDEHCIGNRISESIGWELHARLR